MLLANVIGILTDIHKVLGNAPVRINGKRITWVHYDPDTCTVIITTEEEIDASR